jgi:hypothetical protein
VTTNKEHFEAINSRLAEMDARVANIEKAYPSQLQSGRSRPIFNWFKTKYTWATNHKGTTFVAGAIFCFAGIVGGAHYKYWLDHRNDAWNRAVDDRVKEVLNAPDGVKQTLDKVKVSTEETATALHTLQPFIQDVIRHQFESASQLPARTLGERLPAVKNLIALAQNERVQIKPAVATSLSQKLLQVDNVNQTYWEVASALINYRWSATSPQNFPPNLPDCTDTEPHLWVDALDFGRIVLQLEKDVYSDCRVTLDSPKDGEKLNRDLTSGTVSHVEFRHCLIVYRGGVVKMPLVWRERRIKPTIGFKQPYTVSGLTLLFMDCAFDFSLPQTAPSIEAQEVTKTFLREVPSGERPQGVKLG